MSNDLSWLGAGLDRVEGHVLDSNGYIAGTTGTVAGGAAGSPGFRLVGAQAFPAAAPSPVTVPIEGDDSYMGGFVYPSAAIRGAKLTAAVQGLDINQILGSGNSYNIGNSSIGFIDVMPFSPVNVALIVTSQAKSQQAGNIGNGIWSGVIIAKCQGIPTGRETFAARQAGAFAWEFVFSPSDRLPWGETFNPTVHGINTDIFTPWSANYRKAMHRFTGDNATLAFGPLLYTPASTSLLDVVVYKNGYRQTTGVTINATTKFITFGSAPATNDVIAVYYDHV